MEEEDDGKVQSDALAGARDHASKRSERRAELFLPVSNHVADINLPGYDKDDQDENGPKLVDEIESLCMNCQENVRQNLQLASLMKSICAHMYIKTGYNPTFAYENPILPRDRPHVVLLRALLFQKHRDTIGWRDTGAGRQVHFENGLRSRQRAASGQKRHGHSSN